MTSIATYRCFQLASGMSTCLQGTGRTQRPCPKPLSPSIAHFEAIEKNRCLCVSITILVSHVCGHAERPADILTDRPATSPEDDPHFKSAQPTLQRAPPDRVSEAWQWFRNLRRQQQAYVVLLLGFVLLFLPTVASIGFVGVERVLVGTIIALEEAVTFAFRRIASFGLVVGILALLATGMYVFVGNKSSK